MHWMSVWIIVGSVISNRIGYYQGRKESKKVEQSYSWECPLEHCAMRFEATNWQILMLVTDGHMENSHGVVQS